MPKSSWCGASSGVASIQRREGKRDMARRQISDVRGIAKDERERERHAKKEAKLASRRKAREAKPEQQTGQRATERTAKG